MKIVPCCTSMQRLPKVLAWPLDQWIPHYWIWKSNEAVFSDSLYKDTEPVYSYPLAQQKHNTTFRNGRHNGTPFLQKQGITLWFSSPFSLLFSNRIECFLFTHYFLHLILVSYYEDVTESWRRRLETDGIDKTQTQFYFFWGLDGAKLWKKTKSSLKTNTTVQTDC